MRQNRAISWSKSNGLQVAWRFRRDDERERGFTLIEVLVAFAIASVCMAVVYQSFSTSLNASRRAEETMNALLIAQSRIAALGAEAPIREGISTGTSEAGFSWTIEIEPLPPDVTLPEAIELPALVRARVHVYSGEPNASPVISLDAVRPAALR